VISIENTNTEMGDPHYLRNFVEETRLTGLRFNFDIGHAHLADGPADERIEKSFAPMKELIAGVHLHDNHGEKDEHLAPYDGTIAWPAAMALLKSVPGENVPLTLELKEKTAHDAPSAGEQLEAMRVAMERFEEEWA
jgi:sugar phosphate isomerase/epimerase